MWIRTQDKMNLIEVQGFQICYIKTKDEEYWEIYTIGTRLGKYNSEERALEVLDEIQAYLKNNYLSISDIPQHNNNPWIDCCPRYITRTTKTVYQMPKE